MKVRLKPYHQEPSLEQDRYEVIDTGIKNNLPKKIENKSIHLCILLM